MNVCGNNTWILINRQLKKKYEEWETIFYFLFFFFLGGEDYVERTNIALAIHI